VGSLVIYLFSQARRNWRLRRRLCPRSHQRREGIPAPRKNPRTAASGRRDSLLGRLQGGHCPEESSGTGHAPR